MLQIRKQHFRFVCYILINYKRIQLWFDWHSFNYVISLHHLLFNNKKNLH